MKFFEERRKRKAAEDARLDAVIANETRLVTATINAMDKINGMSDIQRLYKEHGIDIEAAQERNQEIEALPKADTVRLNAYYKNKFNVELIQSAGAHYTYSKQSEIGAVGTRIVDGRIEVEHNPRLKPYWFRGRISKPGIAEEIYRTEPIAFKSLNEIEALVANATYEPGRFEGVDAETLAITEKAHKAIMACDFDRFLANASTAFKCGFAPFEKVWKTTPDKFVCIEKLAFREQSTVDRWLWGEKQDELVGAEFRFQQNLGRTKQSPDYTLPAGKTRASARLLVVNIHATGNNIEGVSPIRVIVGLRKLKELLLQISGVSFQKYGVPVATIVRELADASAGVLGSIGDEANKSEIAKIVARLQNLRAKLGPVLDIPIGLKLEYQTPTNDMPDITPVLHYIDTMIAMVFHNEGALLGNQSFGSYAMAAVSDNKFMRAAPVYAKRISVALTEVLHDTIRFNHSNPDSIEVWPHYTFRFAGTQDASAWTEDMAKLVAAGVGNWPDEARRMAAANMGLSVDAFDDWKDMAAQTQWWCGFGEEE